MIKEEASPPSKHVRLNNETDIATPSKSQKIISTCSNVTTWIKIDKIALTLVGLLIVINYMTSTFNLDNA